MSSTARPLSQGTRLSCRCESLRVLVCGMPRSGTTYFTSLLNASGIPASHERTGPLCSPAGPSSFHPRHVDVSCWPAPNLWRLDKGVALFLLVRDPRLVVESFMATGHAPAFRFWEQMYERGDGRVAAVSRLWAAWNRMILTAGPINVIRLDQIRADIIAEIAGVAGVEFVSSTALAAIANTRRYINGHPKRSDASPGLYGKPVLWSDLDDEAVELAESFGFSESVN